MSKPKNEIPIARLEQYNQLIKLHQDIERKGKTTPYTSVNGHMFSFLTNDGTMGLRLSENDRDTFIEKYQSCLMEQHGRVMKEFIVVPEVLFENLSEMAIYLKASFDYVSRLKPKPTKKK